MKLKLKKALNNLKSYCDSNDLTIMQQYGTAGLVFQHEDFAIKANFSAKGIEWQTNAMDLKSRSLINTLKENKDVMYIYSLGLEAEAA